MTGRTPTLSPEQRERVREILSRALECASGERARFVREAAGEDDSVYDEAISLLGVSEELVDDATGSGDLLASLQSLSAERRPHTFEAGHRVGRYTIIEEIGRGGFAVVYLAEQHRPLVRRVALKVLSLGIESEAAAERFRIERQVLASLEAPGIASIFDAGTTRCGRLYFAMELVDGQSITRHCDGRLLTIRERLELFARVCDAVHHAHQRGVIHRDLKPSNILVPSGDADPTPRVIDFGIAKVTSPGVENAATMGGHVLGTPDYMSPEQFRPGEDAGDIRTDVYSLGVVLYELLVGALPFERGVATPPTGTTGEAPSPSRRLRTADVDAGRVAQARSTDPASLRRQLHGELAWILARAIQERREARYASVAAMALDVRNHLAGLPLSVGPESAGYRARKFVARHRWPVGGAIVAALALAAGVIGTGAAAMIANRNAREASVARDAADAESYAARVNLLGTALNTGNRTLATSLCERLGEDLVSWEARYIDARLSPWLWSRRLPGGSVGAIAPTADGELIGVLVQSGDLHLLSAATGQTLSTHAVFSGQEGWWRAPSALSFNAAGDRLLAGDWLGRARLLDMPSLETVWDVELGARVIQAEFSAALAAFVLLLEDGRLLSVPEDGIAPAELASFSEEYSRITLGSGGRRASLAPYRPGPALHVDLSTGVVTSGDEALYTGVIAAIPGTPHLIAATHDAVLDTVGADIFDADTGDTVRRMTLETNLAGKLRITDDGRFGVFTPTYSPLVGSIDLDRHGAVHWVGAHDADYVTEVACLPNGLAVSGANDGSIRLWDPTKAEGARSLRFGRAFLTGVSADPDGSVLAVTGMHDVHVALIDLETNESIATWNLSEHPGFVSSVRFSRDSKLACVLYSRGRVEVRTVPDGALVKVLSDEDRASTGYALRSAFSPDGRLLATPDSLGRVRVWSAHTLELLGAVEEPNASMHEVVFSPDGSLLVAAWSDPSDPTRGGVSIWNTATMREVHRVEPGAGMTAVALDPSGRRLVAGGLNGAMFLYELHSGHRTELVGMGTEMVSAVSFTPDSTRVLGTGHIQSTVLWNAQTGANLLTISGPSVGYNTNDIEVLPDGTLVTCGGNVVQIHPVRPRGERRRR